MAKQGLLVIFSLVLLVCSTIIPACINARSVDAMRSETKTGLNTGCYNNPNSKYKDDLFCCSCDHKCIWSDMQQCQADCAREDNCANK
ncbi:unnamed protein product [Urochloa decumbens]|uniref:Uncharacterized protein n=1 Tax=Urochloa decumbens TaxID=240449 RepID=A0ABC9BAM2_9POAL